MKITIVVLFFVLVILPVSAAGYILWTYLQNDFVGVSTNLALSNYLKNKPLPFAASLTVKVVTFNIQDLWVVGRNRPERMRHIGRVITAIDPDIVGFQESFIAKDRAILLEALRDSRLNYIAYYPSGTVGSGLLICSAWPIYDIQFKRYTKTNPAYRIWEGDFWAGKGAALARIESPEGMIDFYCTHAQAGYGVPNYRDVRVSQMKELAEFITMSRTGTSPAILVGDMNCGEGREDYETVVKGANLTRAMNMESRIDHIFTVNDPKYQYEVLDTIRISETINEGGRSFSLSDHAGYMSTIRVIPLK